MSKWYYYCIILSILFAVLQFSNSKSGKIDNYEYDYDDRKYYGKDYNRSAFAESGEEFDAYVYYDRNYILLPQNGEDTKESKFVHNCILWTK